MKQIKLTKNKYTIVDDEDFEFLSKFRWCFHFNYAVRRAPKEPHRLLSMHRFLLNPREHEIIDHINMNGLDNRKKNLRIVTKSQNMMNRGKQLNNTTGFKGVSLDKRKKNKKWRANIQVEGKYISLGYFLTAQEASNAYLQGALKYHKDYAKK